MHTIFRNEVKFHDFMVVILFAVYLKHALFQCFSAVHAVVDIKLKQQSELRATMIILMKMILKKRMLLLQEGSFVYIFLNILPRHHFLCTHILMTILLMEASKALLNH